MRIYSWTIYHDNLRWSYFSFLFFLFFFFSDKIHYDVKIKFSCKKEKKKFNFIGYIRFNVVSRFKHFKIFILILNIIVLKWIFINLDNMIYYSSSRKVYQDIFDWLYILFDLVYEICNEFYVLSFCIWLSCISIFALYCYSILFQILSDITRIRRNSHCSISNWILISN